MVHARYEALGERVRRAPDPLDVPSLAARTAACAGRVVAVEALWDGDTVHDWFVLLVAVLDDPEGEGHLATVHEGPRGAPPGRAAADAAARRPITSVCRSTSLPRTRRTTTLPAGARPTH
ncbi:hypothetical protein AB6O49_00230 [Streptomyces sp. SBR177]